MRMSDDVPKEMAEAGRLVTDFISKVSEHVDSVTVFINKRRDDGKDGTLHMINGSGNWYARFGQIADWVEDQKAAHYRSHAGEDGAG
jgi:hypothetical protein